jgi:[NiFe] hydrogenase diaphorase moiety small subunit
MNTLTNNNFSMAKKKNQVTITIDGKEFQTEAGTNLVKAAKEKGIFIPSLCYFESHKTPLGTCRVCTCNIDGDPGPACMAKAKDGMAVEVHQPELQNIRKAIVEMMFSEGNHFCPSCEKSGSCDLQHMGYEMGMDRTRFPHIFKDRLIDFNPKRMVIEHNRCVKCHRCVEEVRTNDNQQVFSFCNRGNETIVGVDYEQEAKLTADQALEAMHLCPTGAILVRGQSFTRPFGHRKFDMQSVQKDFGKTAPKKAKTKEPREKKTIATISLAGWLDIDLELLDLVEFVEFNKSPINDIKTFTKRCHMGLIEGGCCNSENVEVLREFRSKCDILVNIGECAIWGGLPAMRNTIPLAECLEEAYLNGITTEPGEYIVPYDKDLPKILDKVYACSEIVKIDYNIPGCPPDAHHIWKVVKKILWNEPYSALYSEFKYD